MIWAGIMFAIIGGAIFFRNEAFAGIPFYLSIIAGVLIVNGLFLSFSVSPYLLQKERDGKAGELLPQSWQNKIIVSLIFSDLGWWGGLLLLVFYLINQN